MFNVCNVFIIPASLLGSEWTGTGWLITSASLKWAHARLELGRQGEQVQTTPASSAR